MHTKTTSSPYARWACLPLGNVTIEDGFWKKRQMTNRKITLRQGYQMLEKCGSLHNFRVAAGMIQGQFEGREFLDSDVYKWMEAVSYDLANQPDAELERLADQTIEILTKAQMPDGYLDTFYQLEKPASYNNPFLRAGEPGERWFDLERGHEMYCAGHLIQAAVAHHRATGKGSLLLVACRVADHIDATFGPGKREGCCGHPEIEMALVELFRETGECRYLNLAGFLVDQRGRNRFTGYGMWGAGYHQDRVPVREATSIEGHAVRQLYLTSGVTDLYMETGETALLDAMQRLWNDLALHKTYLTGGYGARHEGESFGESYELPSDRCYGETCAAIAGMMWHWRMLQATGEARFADAMERTLYNGFLSGLALDGKRYFYVNPLMSRGGIERTEWYEVACCPPNIMRQLAAIGTYVATTSPEGLQIHHYISATVHTSDGFSIRLQTEYPHQGGVVIEVLAADESQRRLSVRIPGWCRGASVRINGEAMRKNCPAGEYADLERTWKAGDRIELDLPMEARWTWPHPRVDDVRGCVAVERGPLTYCFEQADQPSGFDLHDMRINAQIELKETWQAEVLDGVMMIRANGMAMDTKPWEDKLYHPSLHLDRPGKPVWLTAVPYYAWANRGAEAMRVWMPSG
jgi:uncharacterized protein